MLSCAWDRRGTARVAFANWVQPDDDGTSLLCSETRVQAYGTRGQVGLAGVRPLIRSFQHLIATEALTAAVRAAETAGGGGAETAAGGA